MKRTLNVTLFFFLAACGDNQVKFGVSMAGGRDVMKQALTATTPSLGQGEVNGRRIDFIDGTDYVRVQSPGAGCTEIFASIDDAWTSLVNSPEAEALAESQPVRQFNADSEAYRKAGCNDMPIEPVEGGLCHDLRIRLDADIEALSNSSEMQAVLNLPELTTIRQGVANGQHQSCYERA